MVNVGKYTVRPMDAMGLIRKIGSLVEWQKDMSQIATAWLVV